MVIPSIQVCQELEEFLRFRNKKKGESFSFVSILSQCRAVFSHSGTHGKWSLFSWTKKTSPHTDRTTQHLLPLTDTWSYPYPHILFKVPKRNREKTESRKNLQRKKNLNPNFPHLIQFIAFVHSFIFWAQVLAFFLRLQLSFKLDQTGQIYELYFYNPEP